MAIFLQLIVLIIGFVLLVKGADILIAGASATAQHFKISKVIIGLTIVAFGTSLPEFSVSISSVLSGATDMMIGNAIGSNIINILLLVGIATLIHPIIVKKDTIRKELPILLLISTALAILLLDVPLADATGDLLTRPDALICLLFFAIFVYYILTSAIHSRKKDRDDVVEKPKYSLPVSLLLIALGVVGLVLGADFVINSATAIAETIGISQRVISLSVIAFGTSLPELITTIQASRKGEQDLLLGNIIGSNIFNICFVLGLPIAIFGTVSAGNFSWVDILMLIASAAILLVVSTTHKRISRLEGVMMLLVFCAYYGAVVAGGLA